MKYTEYYICNVCGSKWQHEWDTDDYNNDYTQCPQGCDEFDFDEITLIEYQNKDT
jgi:hypothetical protein